MQGPINVNLDLGAPLTKLVEVAANGVGEISQPALTILNAHAEGKAALIRQRYARQLQLQQIRDEREVRAVMAATPPEPTSSEALLLGEVEVSLDEDREAEVQLAGATFRMQTLQRRANAMAVIGEAADCIGDKVSADPIDADWVTRFFHGAQDVSTSDLQKLWGGLLAREVTRPGAIPLRTLELLRTMTRQEADLIRKLKMHMTEQPFGHIIGDSPVLTPDELHLLRDMGVLPELGQPIDWAREFNPQTAVMTCWRTTLKFFGGAHIAIKAHAEAPGLSFYPVGSAAAALIAVMPETTDAEYVQQLYAYLTDRRSGKNEVELTQLGPGA